VNLGKTPTNPKSIIRTFTLDNQLGGFFGKDGNRINELGFVIIDASCLYEVDSATTLEPIIPLATPPDDTNS